MDANQIDVACDRLVKALCDRLAVKFSEVAQDGEAAARMACPEDSGTLAGSIAFTMRRVSDTEWDFWPHCGTKYAGVHEYGGYTHPRVSYAMQKWAWATYKFGNRAKPFQGPGDSVFWGIAVTKKATLEVYVPPSRFMLAGIRVVRARLENK